MEFFQAVEERRSCRKFRAEPVPESVVNRALDAALLAPNSSNMQLWKFLWVRDAIKKAALVEACFSQPAAATASDLIVVVADWSKWRAHRRMMIEQLKANGARPGALQYYEKLIPLVYTYGPGNLIGMLKWIGVNTVGLFRPTPRGPNSRAGVALIAVKSAALAAENFMLAMAAQGYGSCPMEGYDAVRVRKLLGVSRSRAEIVMTIGVGKVDPAGIYGPRIRFDRALAIEQV